LIDAGSLCPFDDDWPFVKERLEGLRIYSMKTLFQFTLVLIAFFIIETPAIAQPLFEVERESFCRSIQDRVPNSPFSGVAEIKKGEGVFLWMEIRAGERALTMLESKGHMAIYHAWASEVGVTDVIDIGITKERWLEQAGAIKGEVKKQGFFTWRTQSSKRNFKEGRWYVSILDANRRPVRKIGSGTEAFRPEIVIKFIP
jgi:hypothetical protein